MAHPALGSLLRYLRRLHDPSNPEATDEELLRRYGGGDEAAFSALVHRHGPMIWGVCRRLLGNEHDAEDAFQAVFLVLLRKAESLRVPQSLAAFLHGVASRIAHNARKTVQRRRCYEARAETPPPCGPFAVVEQRELRALLDEELLRLPEKYRLPLVLCYLEGKSYTEAAQQLGWRDGTVCGRLARARELLRKRLSRRGLSLSLTALAAVSEPASASAATVAAVSRMAALFALGQAASNGTVAALAQSAVHAMSMAKLKAIVALGVLVGLFAAGTGWTAYRMLAIAGREIAIALPVQGTSPSETGGWSEQPATQERPGRDSGADANRGAEVDRPMRSLRGHRERITSVAYASDGRWIATAAWDGTARLWDAQTGKELRRLDVPATRDYRIAHLSQILFSPDNQFVVAVQQSGPKEPGVIVWNRSTGERVRDFPGLCVALSPDGRQISCGGWGTPDPNRGDIQVYELATGKTLRVVHTPYSHIHSLAFAPDGQALFGQVAIPRPPLGNGMSRMGFDPVEIHAWDPATGKARRTRLDGKGGLVPIAFSPDGRSFAMAYGLWEVATGESRVELTGHTDLVCAVAFAPDGRTVATGSQDGTVRLWELPSGKEIVRFGKEVPKFAGRGWVLAVAFSPDGRTLVSGGLDRIAQLWDVSRFTRRRSELLEGSPAELEKDWRDLSGNAAAGYAAVGRLISSPKRAVPFLEKQLQAIKPLDSKRIERLIADLDDEQFAVRERAVKELDALAETAGPALRRALSGKPTLEARRRLEALLDRLDGGKLSAETIRWIRAVEALEAIGSPEVRRLLDKLAAGSPETRLTQEASAAARRLAKRIPVAP